MTNLETRTKAGTATSGDTGAVAQITAQVLRSARELAALEDDWNALLARCGTHKVFSTPEWLLPIAQVYEDAMPVLAVAVYAGDELIGLAPFGVVKKSGRRVLRFMGAGPHKYPWSDFMEIIAADGREDDVAGAVVRAVKGCSKEWDVMDMEDFSEHSPALGPFMREASRQGLVARQERFGSSYYCPLPGSWEDFLATLSSNFRGEIERKARKAERDWNGRYEIMQTAREIDRGVDVLIKLHTAQRNAQGAPGMFAFDGADRFVREAAHRLAGKGWLQLGLLTGDHGDIGVLICFRYRGVAYYYNSGFDPSQDYSKFSLGTLLIRAGLKNAVDCGDETFDFLRGDGGYKSRYNVTSVQHYRVRVWSSRRKYLMQRAVEKLDQSIRRNLRSVRRLLKSS